MLHFTQERNVCEGLLVANLMICPKHEKDRTRLRKETQKHTNIRGGYFGWLCRLKHGPVQSSGDFCFKQTELEPANPGDWGLQESPSNPLKRKGEKDLYNLGMELIG